MNRDNLLGYILPSLMWTAVITLVLVQMGKPGKALQAVEHWPTVDIAPITVQMDDPYPCSTNPEYRAAYQRLGAVCAGLDR